MTTNLIQKRNSKNSIPSSTSSNIHSLSSTLFNDEIYYYNIDSTLTKSQTKRLFSTPFNKRQQSSKFSFNSSFNSDIFSDPFQSKYPIQSPKERKKPKINFIKLLIKIIFSTSILLAMILGYIFSIKLLAIGTLSSIGLYGAILIGDFFIQFSCAILNRISINKIVSKQKLKLKSSSNTLCPNADLAITCVGYREDEKSWRECLKSLQDQTVKPRIIICVIDGDEKQDLLMANAFEEEFQGKRYRVINFPKLLSSVHKTSFQNFLHSTSSQKEDSGRMTSMYNWLTNSRSTASSSAIKFANQCVEMQINDWIERYFIDIHSLEAICIVQPHGHKRTAMYTSFALALYGFQIKDAIFTTDSDTLVQQNAIDEMFCLLQSDDQIGGVTADVKIWNKSESILARMCSVRYWMAFNIERGCQSFWNCVGCISGPMGMYRSFDLLTILGLWNLQTFFGKETTFGDDRHLTNQILSIGLKTKYTHRTYCESESPTRFIRWVKQQTRWSKSFFREAFWFPIAFGYHSWWLLVETIKQTLYPFILTITVCHFLFNPSTDPFRPLVWLTTMFLVALIKSIVAVLISRDIWMLTFSGYGFIYFFGLLPSKFYALFTVNITSWGTSARSQNELRKGDSFFQRSFHVAYLVFWYALLAFGLGLFISRLMNNWLYLLIGLAFLPPSIMLYIDTLPRFTIWSKKPSQPPAKTFSSIPSTRIDSVVSSTLVNPSTAAISEKEDENQSEISFHSISIPTRKSSHKNWIKSSTQTIFEEIEQNIEFRSDCSLKDTESDIDHFEEYNDKFVQIDDPFKDTISTQKVEEIRIEIKPLQPPLPAFFRY